MNARRASLTLATSVLMAAQAVAQPQPQVHVLPDVVVTATGRPESMTRIAGTMQVISQERIEKSSAKNVTDLLAENAVGFMSQWTQAQTSLNIRGAATEGQGRDFRSQILILVNGHRAGTANVSKLSVADVERIEIVRGPSSVVYGSQNMGGVVNIILKNGRMAPGNLFEGATGSWSLIEGKAQTGGTDGQLAYYFGANAGTQSEYQVGGGQVERNTQWTRFGATAALGWDFSDDHRVDVVARTDGVYDAGFRGSSANLFAYDTRYNQSVDVTYNGKSADGGMSLMFQTYYVRDVDDLNNPSPLSTLNALASRTNVDRNRRQLDIVGARFQPGFKPWAGNEFLLGIDWERSWIRSERFRRGGSAVTQLSPQDNNQTENVFGFYVEDAQRFLDDRVTVRGGVRYTTGATALDWTPNAPTLIPGTTGYNATTYSAGATFQITDWLTARAGSSTGFRAPTATELGANFTTTPIGTTIFGNPGLAPETAQQIEAGATLNWGFGRFDAAIFQNLITNRIQAVTVSSIGGRVIQRFQNNPANIQVQGLEFQLDADVLKTLSLDVSPSWQWSIFGNGYYNFKMTDYGAVAAAGTDMATRINQYQAAIGTRFGQVETRLPWNLQILGILRGPMWYNTEEALSPVFFPGQMRNTTVYRKAPFWVWNTRGEIEVRKGITLFAAVNNVFDMNQHPIFITLDTNPCGANLPQQNGSCGNSMPGREVIVGFQLRW